MDPELDDLHEWELLHNSEDENNILSASDSDENLTEVEELGEDCAPQGIGIMSDHFSIDSNQKFRGIDDVVVREGNNLNLIDSGFTSEEVGGERKGLVGNLLDLSSDWCVDVEFVDSGERKELGCVENGECSVEFNEIGEVLNRDVENSSGVLFDSGEGRLVMAFGHERMGNEVDFGGEKELPPSVEPVGDESGRNDTSTAPLEGERHAISMDSEVGVENGAIQVVKSHGEIEKRRVTWWKLPMELLKYSLFRGSSVWSVSMGVAMMGFLLLGRSLYKMKSKRRSLQLKVTVDDKKVSQFMQSAARLNEAFSVVRRVPMIRPMLPAPGAAQWPMMNMR